MRFYRVLQFMIGKVAFWYINQIQQFDSDRIWGKICESIFGSLRHLDQTGYQGFKQSGQEILFDAAESIMDTILHSSTVLLFDDETNSNHFFGKLGQEANSRSLDD